MTPPAAARHPSYSAPGIELPPPPASPPHCNGVFLPSSIARFGVKFSKLFSVGPYVLLLVLFGCTCALSPTLNYILVHSCFSFHPVLRCVTAAYCCRCGCCCESLFLLHPGKRTFTDPAASDACESAIAHISGTTDLHSCTLGAARAKCMCEISVPPSQSGALILKCVPPRHWPAEPANL